MKNYKYHEKITEYLLFVLKNIFISVIEMSQQKQFVICKKFSDKNEQFAIK